MILASIPSPSSAELHLGSLPLRGYALMIILGVVAAVIIADRRLVVRGFPKGTAADVATWAVPFGIVGARIYHVATDPELYFDKGKHPVDGGPRSEFAATFSAIVSCAFERSRSATPGQTLANPSP